MFFLLSHAGTSYPLAPHTVIAYYDNTLGCIFYNTLQILDPWVDKRVGLLWQQRGLRIGCL